ncbi:MAG: hypothetical protein CMP12_19905 [Zunongwangia sp.]|uniref:Uncharacterized protein n=2 Tax=Zunongwangia profunda TaxID=398743 RepID=D5BEJ8_ZUNPS|nr:hypothetical protein [Zunongwangia profunda]ADF54983.1 hypothetical protein ZPR_4683 [Zunongwangia profunda SM-A87]MAO38129.1 hypothetical protein [Zunongwangia sp.]HCV83042.1 hypothetical protein [Zunongwangia profunda]|tara:strand:+ start:319 stop:504 length:186 start_codon:yes stop_codon:yes gene_type:complete
MGLEFDYKDGQTPLDDDEKESSPQKASRRTNFSQKIKIKNSVKNLKATLEKLQIVKFHFKF